MKFATVGCFLLATTVAANAEAPLVSFAGISTNAGIEQNLDALNKVTHTEESRIFDDVWGGVTLDDWQIMIGTRAQKIALLTATKLGYFAANDRADIVAMETEFGLTGLQRSVGECGPTFSEIECVALFYACPEAPPTCHITVLSFGTASGTGRTRLSWAVEPEDITSR